MTSAQLDIAALPYDAHNTVTTVIAADHAAMEVCITRPTALHDTTPVIIISHPHPLYGGSMSNKVVHILAKSFIEQQAITVRYNFRGVGQSEGEHDQGRGEAEDLQWLASQIRQNRPDAPLWLAGFSFGAYVTTRAQAQIQAERLVLVAPPVSMYDFDELEAIRVPWCVIQGGQDEVISAEAVRHWVQQHANPPKLVWLDDASHFFHGKLNDIKDALQHRCFS